METLLTVLSVEEAALLPESLCRAHFPQRLEWSHRFYHREDAWRCLGAGFLLYSVLKVEETDLAVQKNGKRYLPGDTRHFSLAHSGSWIVLAVDENEIGADVEKTNLSHLRIAPKVLLPEEYRWMQGNPEERFFQLWTLKESVMKLHGEGLGLSPASFSVLELAKGGTLQRNGEQLWSCSLKLQQHSLSFCTLHPLEKLQYRILYADGSCGNAESLLIPADTSSVPY